MMIPFTPSNTAAPPFQTTVTLDGNSYSLVTMWNLYSFRWYVSITDSSGALVCNQPLVGSPNEADIPLFPGFFMTSTIVFRAPSQQFEISP